MNIAAHHAALLAFERSREYIFDRVQKGPVKVPKLYRVAIHSHLASAQISYKESENDDHWEFHAIERPGHSLTIYCRETGTVIYRVEEAHFD